MTDRERDPAMIHPMEDGPKTGVSVGAESVEALTGREVAEPVLDTAWTATDAAAKKKGGFRIYLGYAPGVGKTFAMLGEGQRRRACETDVLTAATPGGTARS